MRPLFALCLVSAVCAASSSVQAQSKGAAPGAAAASKGATGAGPGQPKAAAAAPAPDAAKAAPVDEDRKLFEEGTADLNAGRYAQAVEKLRAAWAKKKAYDVAGNLGTALMQLGKRAEAARLLAYAVTSFPAGGSPKEKAWVEETFASVRKEVVLVHVHVSVEGADVSVNGDAIGKAPISEDVFAEPGAVVVEAKKDGFEDARVELKGDKGATIDATVTMKAKGETPPPEPNRLPAYIAFGAGGAGLVLGAITGGVSLAKYGDVTKSCSGNTCPAGLRGDADAGTTLAHVSTVGFVVAGVGAAVGVTLLLLPSQKNAPARAALTVGPSFIGVKGAF